MPDLALPGPWARMKIRAPSIDLGRFPTLGRMGLKHCLLAKGEDRELAQGAYGVQGAGYLVGLQGGSIPLPGKFLYFAS